MAKGDFQAAEQLWQASERRSDPRVYVAARRWQALCHYYQGDFDKARDLAEASLQDAVTYGYERSIALHYAKMAMIHLAQQKIDDAERALEESRRRVAHYRFSGDIAEIQYLTAQLHLKRGNIVAAGPFLNDAIDRFQRMGLRRELAEAIHTRDELGESQFSASNALSSGLFTSPEVKA